MDETDDDLVPFPLGLQMVSGDALTRSAPASGDLILDPEDGTPQPAQWTCPRSTNAGGPTYLKDSDGSRAGIQDSSGADRGAGFPLVKCDGLYSPLRADLHFPSCYNPEAGLENWQNNMAWPSRKYQKNNNGRKNCPPGFIHVPRLFFEYYWNTQAFNDRWEVGNTQQPFVLSNGDRTGFSLHGDFASGWELDTLEWVIGNCDAGTIGMDKCFSDLDVSSFPECKIESPVKDTLTGVMDALPCNNPVVGWGVGDSSRVELGPVDSPEPSLPAADAPSSSAEAGTEAPKPASEGGTSDYNALDSPVMGPAATETKLAEPSSASQGNPAHSVPSSIPTPLPSSGPEVHEEDLGTNVHTVWVTETFYVSTTVTIDGPEATGASPSNQHTGFTYQGCYRDTKARVLPHWGPHGSINQDVCMAACSDAGFDIFGLEYGGECFCGNSLQGVEKIAESECNMPCEGNATQVCGGPFALTVFARNNVAIRDNNRLKRSPIQGHNHRRYHHGHIHDRFAFSDH